MPRRFFTADLCDAFANDVAVAKPLFAAFGSVSQFCGPLRTVRCFEDNSLVRLLLESPGDGAVLVVDGGGSDHCALLGGMLAELADSNGWSGIIMNGYLRDSLEIEGVNIGVRALGSCPRKSEKKGQGEQNCLVTFAGVEFHPGHFVYVDEDGIVVAARDLLLPGAAA